MVRAMTSEGGRRRRQSWPVSTEEQIMIFLFFLSFPTSFLSPLLVKEKGTGHRFILSHFLSLSLHFNHFLTKHSLCNFLPPALLESEREQREEESLDKNDTVVIHTVEGRRFSVM